MNPTTGRIRPAARRLQVLFAFALLLFLLLPATASAHAILLKAVPEANSQMASPPPRIELTFNERIEDSLYSIKVIDEIGRSVAPKPAVLNADHNGIGLDLPKLPNGNYVVTYHVISADGHPVDGSYVLTIGDQTPPAAAGNAQHHHSVSVSTLQPVQYFQFAARIVYYVTLLSLVGWVLWIRLLGPAAREQEERLRGWTLAWQRAFLLSLLFLIYTHFRELLGDAGFGGLVSLFFGTLIGLSWVSSLVLSGIGFALLLRNRTFDIVWVVLLIAAKCMNGHAAAATPQALTLPLDGIHLLAASLWVGGLWMIVVFRKEGAAFLSGLVAQFSRTAFWSITALIVTGVLSTLLFLPKLSDVLYTQWGTLLLVKTGVVLLVVLIAAFIRMVLRRKGAEGIRRIVLADFTLMLVILGIVGILTYVAPVPANEPLYWHVMGDTRHITVKISPNAPGDNEFIVKVWMDEKLGDPKYVKLLLTPNDRKDVAPIEVPIQTFNDTELDTSYGFKRYSYKAQGAYLPFAGSWRVQVRVMDSNDDETVYNDDMRLY